MNINSILKREGIEIKSKLDMLQVNKIAEIITDKLCDAFPEHNLNRNDIFSILSKVDMYFAKLPSDSAVAKYFYKNNSIYFSDKINFNTLDTLVIHECIHALQGVKNSKGKLLRLGLFNLNTRKGQGLNEASVQLMSSKATNSKTDSVKYYNMNFNTESPLFYPIETALLNQIMYFTGSYPLFHSTLYGNNVFKNTFIAKTNKKVYHTIESNFDLLIHYEELLALSFTELANSSQKNKNLSKIKKLNTKIDSIKSMILNLTLSIQNIIMENCFNNEFELIKDSYSLNDFRQRLYNFSKLLINTDSYHFYNSFYCEMMNRLEEKSELIKKHGVLTYLNDLQTDLLDLERDTFGFSFFHKLFNKLKLLVEDTVREKT